MIQPFDMTNLEDKQWVFTVKELPVNNGMVVKPNLWDNSKPFARNCSRNTSQYLEYAFSPTLSGASGSYMVNGSTGISLYSSNTIYNLFYKRSFTFKANVRYAFSFGINSSNTKPYINVSYLTSNNRNIRVFCNGREQTILDADINPTFGEGNNRCTIIFTPNVDWTCETDTRVLQNPLVGLKLMGGSTTVAWFGDPKLEIVQDFNTDPLEDETLVKDSASPNFGSLNDII